MTARGWLAACLLALALPGFAEGVQIYRCVTDGRTVFQEQPCAGGSGGSQGGEVTLSPINAYDSPAGTRATTSGSAVGTAKKNAAGWYSGYDGYVAALRESERSGVPMLVYFYTNWCPHCRHVDNALLPDAAVSERLSALIKVRVNAEGVTFERALFGKFQAGGVPYMIVQKGNRVRQVSIGKKPALFLAAVDAVLPALK